MGLTMSREAQCKSLSKKCQSNFIVQFIFWDSQMFLPRTWYHHQHHNIQHQITTKTYLFFYYFYWNSSSKIKKVSIQRETKFFPLEKEAFLPPKKSPHKKFFPLHKAHLKGKKCSDRMKRIKSNTKVDVIHLKSVDVDV